MEAIGEFDDDMQGYYEALNDSLLAFQELLSTQYKILLGRKNITYNIDLLFYERNYVHLAGIDKLKDIPEAMDTPNIYNVLIKNDDVSESIKRQLIKSEYFSDIVWRLYSIIDLKDNFASAGNNAHYKFVAVSNKVHTLIDYDYFIKSKYKQNAYYYFLRYNEKSSNTNECVIVSTFIENVVDYSIGQSYMTLLEKSSIDLKTGKEENIYKRKNSTNDNN